jgi:hypothetical protein
LKSGTDLTQNTDRRLRSIRREGILIIVRLVFEKDYLGWADGCSIGLGEHLRGRLSIFEEIVLDGTGWIY